MSATVLSAENLSALISNLQKSLHYTSFQSNVTTESAEEYDPEFPEIAGINNRNDSSVMHAFNTIYICNIAFVANEMDLRKHIENHGFFISPEADAVTIFDKMNTQNQRKRWAFVKVYNAESVVACLDQKPFMGRRLGVSLAKRKTGHAYYYSQ